jgi:hypothetical protein
VNENGDFSGKSAALSVKVKKSRPAREALARRPVSVLRQIKDGHFVILVFSPQFINYCVWASINSDK